MKRVITIYIFSLIVLFNVKAQTFNEQFGVFQNGWADIASNVEYVNDSIYINFTDQNPNGGRRMCVSNISLNGVVNWSRCYDRAFTGRVGGFNLLDANTNDGSYILGQSFRTLDPEDEDETLYLTELVKFNQNFDTLYTTIVGDSINFFQGKQAKFTADGGAVMVGWTHAIEPEEGPLNLWFVKFDADGNEEWQSTHSTQPGSWDAGYSIEVLNNGNFIVGSYTSNGWGEPNRPVITLFDSLGVYLNHQEFGNDQYSEGWANVTALSDGNFVFSGSKQDSEEEDLDYIVKFDSLLNIIWEKEYYFYSAETSLTQIKENEDGSLIACGVWEDNITTHDYGSLIKLDANGELLWHRLYQNANDGFFQTNRLYDVVPIPNNGGYVACGERNAPDNGQNYWVLKVDSMGCLVEGCDTITSVAEIKEIEQIEFITGPNPATDYLNVFLPEIPAHLRLNEVALELRNLEGKLIETLDVGTVESTLILDVKNYARGTYLLTLTSSVGVIQSQKIVLE